VILVNRRNLAQLGCDFGSEPRLFKIYGPLQAHRSDQAHRGGQVAAHELRIQPIRAVNPALNSYGAFTVTLAIGS